eukprot:TRINITY_DN27172_c0_g1_i1.p1 TRINITY_DN27172_c0_g1~~TRINITY_DN27172_c0_g1_i1.p1  ORF type:complete len:639 (+),score=157.19 TRINITY_DN27172_c0_g1_i1:142-2058(+)
MVRKVRAGVALFLCLCTVLPEADGSPLPVDDTTLAPQDRQLITAVTREAPVLLETAEMGNFGFEDGNLGGWSATGTAFSTQPTKGDNPRARGAEPARQVGQFWVGTKEAYNGVKGKPGDIQGDSKVGTLTSEEFTVERDTLTFLLGGGDDEENEFVELVVDGKSVRKATGSNSESMERQQWDVGEFISKPARIRIVDSSSGTWGHINVDDFVFSGGRERTLSASERLERQAILRSVSVVERGRECVGTRELIAESVDTVEACARACRDRHGCAYFLVGLDANKGKCYSQEASDCANLRENSFDLYKYDATALPEEYSLKAQASRCVGQAVLLSDDAPSTRRCSQLCKQQYGCEFFAFGTGEQEGYCYWERSSSCASTTVDHFNVFQLEGYTPVAFKLLKTGEACNGPDQLLGEHKSVIQCGDLCRAQQGCKYFTLGTAEHRGRCYWQKSDCEVTMRTTADLYEDPNAKSQLIKVGAECTGADELLAVGRTVAQCQMDCQEKTGCEVFLVGTGTNTGRCYWEKNACESYEESDDTHYDVYRLPAKKPTFKRVLVKEGAECAGEDQLLGDDVATPSECSALCAQQDGCEFFMSGVAQNAGKCFWEKGTCSEFMDNDYNVYANQPTAVSYTHLTLPTKRIV